LQTGSRLDHFRRWPYTPDLSTGGIMTKMMAKAMLAALVISHIGCGMLGGERQARNVDSAKLDSGGFQLYREVTGSGTKVSDANEFLPDFISDGMGRPVDLHKKPSAEAPASRITPAGPAAE
jgi:hypothetical protein